VRRFALFLAIKHIRRRILQSVLTVLGVAVGVMVLVTALSLTNGFIAELVRSTLQATPHITLSAGFADETFAYDPEILRQLEVFPEVVAVAPFITTQALIARRANKDLGITATRGYTQIIGIDPVLEQKVLADLPQLAELNSGDGIVLGRSLGVRQLGVIPGDKVQILNELQKRQEFTVSGTFRVGNELIDALLSYTSIPVLQDYLNAPGAISGYHLRVQNPERASSIGQALAQQSGLIAQSWQSLFSNLIEQLKLQKALIGVVVFLIVLVAAMGIANILILTVAEKTEEIAILRAMGASQGKILTVFMLEGILLGGLGTLLGALLGFAISLYFKLKPFPLPGDLYFITALPVDIQAFDFIWVCGLSLATSIIAGIIPARRASGLDPVQILR
jgi:lipoprotein-releasing system permease protein